MTSSKTLNNFLFYFSIFFLVISIVFSFIGEERINWNTFFSTDGLSLIGMIFTLLTLLGMKVPVLRKMYRKTLLFFNRLKFSYELTMVVDANMELTKIHKIFERALKNAAIFDEKEMKIFNKNSTLIRFSSAGMGAVVTLREEMMTSDYQEEGRVFTNRYKIEIKGRDDYKAFQDNKKFILDIICEKLQAEQVRFNKFYVKVNKDNLAYNMLNENYLLLDKSSKVTNSVTEITKANSNIMISKFDGIQISSRNKGEFNMALDFLEDILVN